MKIGDSDNTITITPALWVAHEISSFESINQTHHINNMHIPFRNLPQVERPKMNGCTRLQMISQQTLHHSSNRIN